MLLLALALLTQPAPQPITDPAPPQAQTERPRFTPSSHGFAFRNSFSGVPLPPAIRDMPGDLGQSLREGLTGGLQLPENFGLCGGMSAAAADLYNAKIARPAETTPPKEGTPLYEYLMLRQNDSMGSVGVMVLKYGKWMMLPDRAAEGEASVATLTVKELDRAVSRLNEGQLVPLGLIYVRGEGNTHSTARSGAMWDNHQVLAYEVRDVPTEPGVRELMIYDSNYPGDDACRIVVRPVPTPATAPAQPSTNAAVPEAVTANAAPEVLCEQLLGNGRKRTVRGFFVVPYVAKTPPQDVGLAKEEKPSTTVKTGIKPGAKSDTKTGG